MDPELVDSCTRTKFREGQGAKQWLCAVDALCPSYECVDAESGTVVDDAATLGRLRFHNLERFLHSHVRGVIAATNSIFGTKHECF